MFQTSSNDVQSLPDNNIVDTLEWVNFLNRSVRFSVCLSLFHYHFNIVKIHIYTLLRLIHIWTFQWRLHGFQLLYCYLHQCSTLFTLTVAYQVLGFCFLMLIPLPTNSYFVIEEINVWVLKWIIIILFVVQLYQHLLLLEVYFNLKIKSLFLLLPIVSTLFVSFSMVCRLKWVISYPAVPRLMEPSTKL